jgi:polyketide cyclase/dehydrase/lipid transport protein
MTMKDDLANRSPDIHWPEGFTPTAADLFSHNELAISASCERVWKHIIEANKWPEWYPNAKDVRILGGGGSVLKADSVFFWTTFGLKLESRINEFVPFSRIGWFGYSPGTTPNFYHTWYLTPEGEGCRVVTDEVGMGEGAVRFRQTDEGAMHRGHDLWLATLKWVSEGK